MPEGSVALRQLARRDAYKAFKESGATAIDVREWCEENCTAFGVEAKRLKHWITEEASNELAAAKIEARTDAQKVAGLVGATLPRALRTLVDGLGAKKVRPLVDRNGVKTGEVVSIDHEIRISSAKEILKVLGAYAPEELKVLAGPLEEFSKLTEEELEKRLVALRKSTGTSDPTGIAGPEGGKGLLLLADAGDPHQGRAGSGEPVQAVSSTSIFPPHLASTRQ